jgi:hypothetical protein
VPVPVSQEEEVDESEESEDNEPEQVQTLEESKPKGKYLIT